MTVSTIPEIRYPQESTHSLPIPVLERLIGAKARDALEILGMCSFGFITGITLSKHIVITLSRTFTLEHPRAVYLGCWLAIFFGCLTPCRKYKRSQVEKALEQIQKASLANSDDILILESKENLRDMPLWTEVSKIRELAKTYCIERIRISDRPDFDRAFDNAVLGKKYKEIHTMGHGNSKGILLGSFFLTNEDPSALQQFKQAIKPEGSIILHSCNTAQGDENFAKDLSTACPEATIHASEAFHLRFNYGKKDDQGAPIFCTWLGEDTTRSYKNGILQPRVRGADNYFEGFWRLALCIMLFSALINTLIVAN